MSRKNKLNRIEGGFSPLPWKMLRSAAYVRLNDPARALLIEFALQLRPDRSNNGQLLATPNCLGKRGKFDDGKVLRAKRALIEAGLIHETVKGGRPNYASWYAVTWFPLARSDNYDAGTEHTFRRDAYLDGEPLPKPKPTREELVRKWDKNTSPTRSEQAETVVIAPSEGMGACTAAHSEQAMRVPNCIPPAHSEQDHIEKPSTICILPMAESGLSGCKAMFEPTWARNGRKVQAAGRHAIVERLAAERGIVLGERESNRVEAFA